MAEWIMQYIAIDTVEGIILYTIIIFLISWIFSLLLRKALLLFLAKNKERPGEHLTTLRFTKNSIRFIFYIIAFLIVVGTVPFLRRQATLIFSGAGILAAIIGFAAQAAISNLIAGIFIVIFKPFRIGDYIKLDVERVGIVIDITLRHTVINTFENKRLIIPNSIISTESILNHSIEDSNVLSFNNFKIGLQADIDLARKIILEEASQLAYIANPETTGKLAEVRVIEIHESFIDIRAYVWITEPTKEFQMKCKLKESVHKRFIEEDIELPIPVQKIVR